MRTFIAIPIPEECLQALERVQKELQSCNADVRWTSVRSIHLTIKFLGEADPDLTPEIAKSLRAALRQEQPFNLCLAELGRFPDIGNPRVLWCGVGGERESLLHLLQVVEATCSHYGFPAEARSFNPHLTLGRIKGRRNLRPLMEKIGTVKALDCSFRADHFNIYKSVLKPQGAVYTVLETIALKR